MNVTTTSTRVNETDDGALAAGPVAATVLAILEEICRDLGREVVITFDDSLTEDLGFDSLMFVDLTVLLEDRLDLEEFPMRAWADREARVEDGKRYTVKSLVQACVIAAREANV